MKLFICTETETYSHMAQQNVISIGRAETNDFHVPVQELSREHCQIHIQEDMIFIVDLESKNGVYVDGTRIEPNQKWPISFDSQIHLSNVCIFSFFQPAIINTGPIQTSDLKLDMPLHRQIELNKRKKG